MGILDVARLIVSIVYTVAGIAAFIVFLIFVNYPASIWALLTGICFGILTYLHILNLKGRLNDWYSDNELKCISYLGVAFFSLGTMGLAYHGTIEIMEKTPILPISQSEAIPMVWCLMTLKGGLLLLYFAGLRYRNNSPEGSRLLNGG